MIFQVNALSECSLDHIQLVTGSNVIQNTFPFTYMHLEHINIKFAQDLCHTVHITITTLIIHITIMIYLVNTLSQYSSVHIQLIIDSNIIQNTFPFTYRHLDHINI